MAKLILGVVLYAIAFAFIYSAIAIAPDMQWPSTDLERIAASLLLAGFAAKLGGAIAILSK